MLRSALQKILAWLLSLLKEEQAPRKLSGARKHAAIEHISIAGTSSKVSPIGLQQFAEFYLETARSAPDGKAGFNPAKYYLVCHSLECALKAYLVLKGHTFLSLSEPRLGHHLDRLLTQAEKDSLADLIVLSDVEKYQIIRAAKYYGEKAFEYPAVMPSLSAFGDRPDLPTMLALTEKLVAALYEPCMNAE